MRLSSLCVIFGVFVVWGYLRLSGGASSWDYVCLHAVNQTNDTIVLNITFLCDGVAQCPEGDDESCGCDVDPTGCYCLYGNLTFTCGDQCFNLSARCDLQFDCTSLEDEIYCDDDVTCSSTCDNVTCGEVRYIGYNKNDSNREPCQCDHLCVVYNDCCPDFGTYCPGDNVHGYNLSETLHGHGTACYDSSSEGITTTVINSCDYDALACMGAGKVDTEEVPVTDLETGIHYRSARCAACNQVSIAQVWNYTVGCEWNDTLETLANGSVTYVQSDGYTCTHVRVYFPYNLQPRPCSNTVIGTCAGDNVDQSLMDECMYGSLDVFTNITYNFRNKACGLCSSASEDYLRCGFKNYPDYMDYVAIFDFTEVGTYQFNPKDFPQYLGNSTYVGYSTPSLFDVGKLTIASLVLLGLALISVAVRIHYQKKLPKLDNNLMTIQRNVCIGLLIMYIMFIISPFTVMFPLPLIGNILAIILHFSFLLVFSWTSVFFVSMTAEVLQPESSSPEKSAFNRQQLLGWGVPGVGIAISVAIEYGSSVPDEFKPGYACDPNCWLTNKYGVLIFLAGPLIVTVTNSVTSICFAYSQFSEEEEEQSKDKEKIASYIALFILMTSTWSLGIVAPFGDKASIWPFFEIFNSLHGIYILCVYVINWCSLKRKLIKCLRRSKTAPGSNTVVIDVT